MRRSDVGGAHRLGRTASIRARWTGSCGSDWRTCWSATKRWARFPPAGEKASNTARADIAAVTLFLRFLTTRRVELVHPSSITRPLPEDYLAWLAQTGVSVPAWRRRLGGLRRFREQSRRHGSLPGPPDTVTLYQEDHPLDERLPRFVTEFVMAQRESPTNLERPDDPTIRNLMIVLIETGLWGHRCALSAVQSDHR